MSNQQARELSRVRLEPARPGRFANDPTDDDDNAVRNTDSEFESEPSDEDEHSPEYEVDCIAWAEYKDSSFERDDGRKGWHYHVLWKGYLKTGSETEEMRSSFDDPDEENPGPAPALLEFWRSVPGKKVRQGKDEPGGKLGEIRYPSDEYLKRKFKEGKPKRNFAAWTRRKDALLSGQPIKKGDSDYYIRKKKRAAKEARLAAEAAAAAAAPPAEASAGEPAPAAAASPPARASTPPPLPPSEPEEPEAQPSEPVAGPSSAPQAALRPPSLAYTSRESTAVPLARQRMGSGEPLAKKRRAGSAEPLTNRKRRKRTNSVEDMPPPAKTPVRATFQVDEPLLQPSPAPSTNSLFDEVSLPSNSQQGQQGRTPGLTPGRRNSFDSLFDESSQPSHSQRPTPSASLGKRASPEKPAPKRRRVVASPSPEADGKGKGKASAADMPPPPAPTFGELEDSIFSSPDTPKVDVPRTPLFDFGDAPTPIRKLPAPSQTQTPMRSDDPDEEEEVLDSHPATSPEIQLVQSRTQLRTRSRTRSPSPITVADSEDEVVETIDPNPYPADDDAADDEELANPLHSSPRKSPRRPAQASPSPAPSSPPAANVVPERHAVPIQSAPAPPAPAPPGPVQSAPAQTASAQPAVGQQQKRRPPLLIALPPSPPRNYRTAGAAAAGPAIANGTPAQARSPANALPAALPAARVGPPPATAATGPAPAKPGLPGLGRLGASGSGTVPAATPANGPVAAAAPPATTGKPPLSINTSAAESGSSRRLSATTSTPASALPTSAGPTSVAAAKLKPSERPKYQQPSKIKIIDSLVDPARDMSVRHLGPGSRPAMISPPAPVSHTLPPAPLPPPPPGQAPAHPPPPAPVPGPPSAVPQRRQWAKKAQPPPQRPMNGNGRSPGQSPYGQPYKSPLAGGQSPFGAGQSPPWAGGGVSPPGAYGGASPYGGNYGRTPPQGGASPMNNGGMSPNAPDSRTWSPEFSGRSSSTAQRSRPPAGPRQQPQPPAAPVNGNQQPPRPPPVPIAGEGNYEAKRDPRRDPRLRARAAPPAMAPKPPAQASTVPKAPVAARRTMKDTHPVCALRVLSTTMTTPDQTKGYVEVQLRSGWSRETTYMLESLIDAQKSYLFERVNHRSLRMAFDGGAQVTEWALVVPPVQPPTLWKKWEHAMKERNDLLVFQDDFQAPDTPVTTHNILVIGHTKDIAIDTVAKLNGFDLGDLELIAVLLKVPLEPTSSIPTLPDPLRPFAEREASVAPAPLKQTDTVALSYGFDDETVEPLANSTLCILPPSHEPTSIYQSIKRQAKKWTVNPAQAGEPPKTFLFLNGGFADAVKSGTFRNTLARSQSRYYSIGHDLQSSPTQWRMRPIWESGCVVTFSPSYLLHHVGELGEFMGMIRTDPNVVAYVYPSTMIWLDETMKRKRGALYPNAIAALNAALFFDDNDHRIAGTMSNDTAGMVVTSAPPPQWDGRKCQEWTEWLTKVFQCPDCAALLKLCRQFATANNTAGAKEGADLLDVEEAMVNDLKEMRCRPHIVPYRRYVIVGSLPEKLRNEAEANGIDCIKPDSLESTLAGAV